MRSAIYAVSHLLEGSIDSLEDWSVAVTLKLCELGVYNHYEFVVGYKDHTINESLRYVGHTGIAQRKLDCIYECMLNPKTVSEFSKLTSEAEDDNLITYKRLECMELRNAILRSAYFVERPRPKRWTNRMMGKLLESNICNKVTMLGILNGGIFNHRLRALNQTAVHRVTLKFLQLAMNSNTGTLY